MMRQLVWPLLALMLVPHASASPEPAILEAQADESDVRLSWTVGDVTEQELYRFHGGELDAVIPLNAEARAYTDPGQAEQPVTYILRHFDGSTWSISNPAVPMGYPYCTPLASIITEYPFVVIHDGCFWPPPI